MLLSAAECWTLVLPFGGFLLFSDLTLHLVHLLALFIQLELLLHLWADVVISRFQRDMGYVPRNV